MQNIKMSRGVTLTFKEGCKQYLENCRQRNLREGTINYYGQSYLYFYKYFDPKMPIEDIDEQTYKDYVIHLKKSIDPDSIFSILCKSFPLVLEIPISCNASLLEIRIKLIRSSKSLRERFLS